MIVGYVNQTYFGDVGIFVFLAGGLWSQRYCEVQSEDGWSVSYS